MSASKSFLHHAFVYWIGRMAARSLTILLLPIYTACLSPGDYGELSILAIVMDVAALVLSFQLPVAIYRFWAAEETTEGQHRVLGSVMLITLVVPTLLLLPVYLNASFFSSLLGMQSDTNLLRLVLAECQLALIVAVAMTEMRVRDQSRQFSLWEIGQVTGIGVVSVILVAKLGWGIWGMFIGQGFIFLLMALYLLPQFLRRVGLCFDRGLAVKMFRFALPLVPSAVAMSAVHSADRFFVQHLVGLEATGLYAIAYKFGTLVSILVTGPFFLIWEPKRFTIAHEKNASTQYGRIFTYLLVLTSFVALALSGLSKEIVQLLTAKEYWSAHSLVPMVAWSYVFFGLSSVVSVGLFVHQKTMTQAWLIFICLAANMLGNWWLIPLYGTYGAALATLISFVLLFGLNLLFSHRYIAIAFEWRRICLLILLTVFAWGCMIFTVTDSLYLGIVLKSFVLFCFLMVLLKLGFFAELRLSLRIMALVGRLTGKKY